MTETIDAETESLLQSYGFDAQRFSQLQERLRADLAGPESNRIQGAVEPPTPDELTTLPPVGSPERDALAALGNQAIQAGEVGVVVLAGGMATRFGGVVKASVPAIDEHTFLDLKLMDFQAAARSAGGHVPVYLMTSFATHADVKALGAKFHSDALEVEAFPQLINLRLRADGSLFRTTDGSLSPYAPGHGDLTFALRRAGLLDRFRKAGGKHLMMSNVDNLTATLDPAIIGAHLQGDRPMTAEMAPKRPGDKGGAPARVDGRLQIVESFRFPETFDQDLIPVFNTNTLVFDAAAIDRDFDLTWFAVQKKVDGLDAVQFERLVGELTAFLPATYLTVARDGSDARFQPVKDPAELVRRQPELRAALSARGIL